MTLKDFLPYLIPNLLYKLDYGFLWVFLQFSCKILGFNDQSLEIQT